MVQESAQSLRALDFSKWGRLGGIIEARRNDIIDALMRALGVVMALNRSEGAAQVGLTQQNQMVKRLTDFPDVTFRVRVAQRRLRGVLRMRSSSVFNSPSKAAKLVSRSWTR